MENEKVFADLKSMLTDIAGKQDEIKASQEEHKEKLAKLEEKFGGHDEILTALERKGIATTRQPEKLEIPVPGSDETVPVYRGYNLDVMGADLKRLASWDASRPMPFLKSYTKIADPGKTERFAKYLIDVLKASREHDPDAIKNLRDMQTKTTLTTSTAATAGYLVPDEYAAEILAFARLNSVALRDCRIMPMGTDVKRVPAEASGVTVAWEDDDTSAFDESNPQVTEVVLTAKRVGAFTVATNDLLDDSSVDIVSWLTGLFAEALGQEMDNQVFAGTGSPTSGLTTAICGYSVLTSGSISTITGTNLSSMIAKLSANKLAGSKFYMHRNIFHYIRTMKTSDNQFIFGPIGASVPNTIWEYPYEIVEKMPYTDGTKRPIVLFGNLQRYLIGVRRQANSLDVDPYGLFKYAQTQFRIYWRIAFACGLNEGFVRLITA